MKTLTKWRFGLRVAVLMGICQACAVGFIVKEATWQEMIGVLLANVGGHVIAYIQKNPPEEVSLNETTHLTKP